MARCLWIYEGRAKSWVQSYKLLRRWIYAESIAYRMAERMREFIGEFDLLVPVPPSPESLFDRDFCPVDRVARKVARRTGIPFGPWLARRRGHSVQHHLGRARRVDGRERGFVLRRGRRHLWPAAVLLLDDVLTTGATVNVLCQLLQAQGVQRIGILAIARSRLQKRDISSEKLDS